jgi:predicted MPP superfamily phosphohydrolase
MSTLDQKDNAAYRHARRPPDYNPNPLHIALILTGLLGHIPPLTLAPAWLALAAIACWPWDALRLPVAALALTFTLADGVGLALLPRLERSFGPVTPPLLALTIVHTAIAFTSGLLRQAAWPNLLLTTVLNLTISAVSVYATWIEPFRLQVTQAKLRSSKLNGHGPLRLLHITDLHVEHITARERKLLRLVKELDPDVILLTGDYLTLSSVHDTEAQAETCDLLAQLCDITRPRCPIYAITGSPPVDHPDVVPAIFERLPITWLLNVVEELHLNGHTLRIAGLRCNHERNLDAPRLRRLLDSSPTQANTCTPFTLLLYHSPDLMPEAVELGIDLYLCGHTHGGQIRLPLFGALVTSSDFWKRYEMGRYEESNTTLYVSRGLGMEGLGAPRARFLAPPEIVLWTLSPSS